MRQRRDAVEVAADADVIDAGDGRGVEDVVDDLVERRLRRAEGVEPCEVARPSRSRSSGISSVPPRPLPSLFGRFCAFMITCATSSLMKAEKKLIMQTPPFFARSRSMSSVMLRGWRQIARHDECVATTGTRVVSMT